ncbi:MAG: 3-deoxy-8-phosphooctulonate synthase [Deltaproteobacteria bacterium]|nr:3-deoxy-8-phosphooctulonate synthase [Deltaproteobacteria bacterium]
MTTKPKRERPLVIAGPCAAESFELMAEVAGHMSRLSIELGFDYVFKASFDKANRTSATSVRGPGMDATLRWFADLKAKFGVRILTDVHETYQVGPVAQVCDYLQIPAFLCRQTDLVVEAAMSGRAVNIKKGQFMAPAAMASVVSKARKAAQSANSEADILLTERGFTFGYGNLVVDMRALPIMAETEAPVILDITHSTQLPAAGGETSGAQRRFAPVLARAATATGYLSGYFLEVHTNPTLAISDKDAQLNLKQATALLSQLVPLWQSSKAWSSIDTEFK